ncbi:MAG: hypothetical protein ACI4WS_04200 [Oscillospiraceae bacterium]
MTKRQIENELNRQLVMFEQEVCNGMVGSANIKFEEFAEDWLRNQARRTARKARQQVGRKQALIYKVERRAYGYKFSIRMVERVLQKE